MEKLYLLLAFIKKTASRIETRVYAVSFLAALLFAVLIELALYANCVTVTDFVGDRINIITLSRQPTEIISKCGLSAYNLHSREYVQNNNYATLDIKSTFPVELWEMGQSKTIDVELCNVQQLLSLQNITLGQDDFVVPEMYEAVVPNMTVEVHRLYTEEVTEIKEIPFQKIVKQSSLLFRKKDYQLVSQQGEDGLEEITYRNKVLDGETVADDIVRVKTLKQAVPQITKVYGEFAPASSISSFPGVELLNGVPTKYSRLIEDAVTTGYSSSGGRGSSGLGLYDGTVAVNPNVIPYGTKMYITSKDRRYVYGFAIATDTGTSLMQGHITADLYYESREESAMHWRQLLDIYILE